MRLAPLASALLLGCAAVCAARVAHADPSSTTPQQAYDLGEIQNPRNVALGGAQVALGTSTSALYGNPGSLPFARAYHFEAIVSFAPQSLRQNYGGAVVDSTNKVAGGFGGTWNIMDPDGLNRQWSDLRAALALGVGDWLGIGIAGRFLRVSQNVSTGPFGKDYVSDGAPHGALFNMITFDAGLTIAPLSALRIGVVGKNLTVPQTSVVPTTLASGIGLTAGVLSIETDLLVDFTTWSNRAKPRFAAGGEVLIFEHVPVRVGYRYDAGQRAHTMGWGLGWIDKKFGVELSARHDIVADRPMTMITLGLRYFYDPGFGESEQQTMARAKGPSLLASHPMAQDPAAGTF